MVMMAQRGRLLVPCLPLLAAKKHLFTATNREGQSDTIIVSVDNTGIKSFIASEAQCMFCFEICTPEGKGGENGGSANLKTKHTESLTS